MANAFAAALRPLRLCLGGTSEVAASACPPGPRGPFFAHCNGASRAAKFVGTQTSYSSNALVEEGHEGYPGARILDLSTHYNTTLLDVAPDALILDGGINDQLVTDTLAGNQADLVTLLATIALRAPNCWTFLTTGPMVDAAKVSTAACDAVKLAAYYAALPAFVAAQAAGGAKVSFVDGCAAVRLWHMMSDGQHTGIGGNALWATALYGGVFYGATPTAAQLPIAYTAVSPTFLPHQIAGCTGEYYAENAVVSAGRAQSWPDTSGNNNTLTAFGAPKPAWQAYPSSVYSGIYGGGGLPGDAPFAQVSFDGLQNGFNAGVSLFGTTAFTAFFVVQKGLAQPSSGALCGQVGGGHATNLIVNADCEADIDAAQQYITSKGPNNVWAVLGIRWNGATLSLIKDATALRSAGALGGTGGNGSTSLGVTHLGGGDSYGNHDVAAFVAYNVALSDANMLLVSRYLGQRFRLAIP